MYTNNSLLKNEGFGMNQDCTVDKTHGPVEMEQEIMDCYLNFIRSPSLYHFFFLQIKEKVGGCHNSNFQQTAKKVQQQ